MGVLDDYDYGQDTGGFDMGGYDSDVGTGYEEQPVSFDDFAGQIGGSYAGGFTGGNEGANVDPYWNTGSQSQPLDFDSWVQSITPSGGFGGALSGLFSGSNLAGLLGAGISAYGANKQNQLVANAQKQQAAQAAARAAAAAQYSSPLRLANPRVATAPTARNGASSWFSDNKVPGYFAEGGDVAGYGNNECWTQYAQGGLGRVSQNYVRGGGTGQQDQVPAMLSDGEYVFDADTVASLGDGNNEAGAAKLDQMRANIRSHKRAAPSHSIPPKAKSTQAYLKGKK